MESKRLEDNIKLQQVRGLDPGILFVRRLQEDGQIIFVDE
jgi:hypothetical protein